jgi:hypothetical protein
MTEAQRESAAERVRAFVDDWGVPTGKGPWNRIDQLVGDIRTLLEQVAAVPVPQGWQTIDSAPRDGTTIMVARDMGESWGWVRGYAYWDSVVTGLAYGTDPIEVAGWISHGFSDPPGELGLGHPTHWMPLPPPPGTEAVPHPEPKGVVDA